MYKSGRIIAELKNIVHNITIVYCQIVKENIFVYFT